MKHVLLALTVALVPVCAAHADELYKWKDERGVVHYTNVEQIAPTDAAVVDTPITLEVSQLPGAEPMLEVAGGQVSDHSCPAARAAAPATGQYWYPDAPRIYDDARLRFGQRAKEVIDRQARAARRLRLAQPERTFGKSQLAVGRDDVRAVGPHDHPVFSLEHIHACVALDQFGKQAFVIRGKVLHQYECHSGVAPRRHRREKRLECRQSTGGGANADHGEHRLR